MAVACERPLPSEAVLSLLEEHWEGPPTPVSGSPPEAPSHVAPGACRHALRDALPVPAPRTLFPLRAPPAIPAESLLQAARPGLPSFHPEFSKPQLRVTRRCCPRRGWHVLTVAARRVR